MTMRLYVGDALAADREIDLPAGAARHAQVRRVQPGDTLRLFDGAGCDWPAVVLAVGRSRVRVRTGAALAVANELPFAVTLALGMPANERMDLLVEKATELGVAAIEPLHCARSVLRLAGERAERKREHWQAVAAAACEQCGRARVPQVAPIRDLADWLARPRDGLRLLLSLQAGATALAALAAQNAAAAAVVVLSGPEGGLSPAEEDAARRAGFVPTALGPRVLRADTAPLVVLGWLSCAYSAGPPRPA